MKKTLNTYQRIKRAAMKGTGVHLSADEAWELYWGDTAIKHVADDSDGWVGHNPETMGPYEEQRRASSKAKEKK